VARSEKHETHLKENCRVRERTDRAWFSRLLRHPATRWIS